jgi:hypothetical protein
MNPVLCGILCAFGGVLGCIYFFYTLNKSKKIVGGYELPFAKDEPFYYTNKESFIDWTRKVFLTKGEFITPTFRNTERNDLLSKFQAYYERLEIELKGTNNHFWYLFRFIESKNDLNKYKSEQLDLIKNFKDFYGEKITNKGGVASFDHVLMLNFIYYSDSQEELQHSDFLALAHEKYTQTKHDKNINQAFSFIDLENKASYLPEPKGRNLGGLLMSNNLKILFDKEL